MSASLITLGRIGVISLCDFRQWFNLQRGVMPGFDNSNNSRGGQLFIEEFAIPQSRMGSAIGPKGSNISAARKIDGVVQVNSSDRHLATSKIHLFQVSPLAPCNVKWRLSSRPAHRLDQGSYSRGCEGSA